MNLEKQLVEGLSAIGLDMAPSQQQKLLDYVALLHKWNKVYSLTAIREPERMVPLHVLDSLAPLPVLGDDTKRVLDVGTGFGTPGIPWAIAHPDWTLVLLDSNSKKTAFLRQVVLELQLTNVVIETARVEHYHPEMGFHIITSRAFACLADFVQLTRHLLLEQGCWAALKGVYPQEEVQQLPAGVHVAKVEVLTVPEVAAERHLVCLMQS